MVAEGYGRAVEYHKIVIGIEIIADENIIPVIAPERRGDAQTIPGLAEDAAHYLVLLRRIRRQTKIIAVALVLTLGALPRKLLIVIGVIQKAGRSLFTLCHSTHSSPSYFVPVEPKPPRLSSLSLSTVMNSSSGCRSMMRNWQMRSFFFICVSRRA